MVVASRSFPARVVLLLALFPATLHAATLNCPAECYQLVQNELLAQQSGVSSSLEQCPCVKPPGSTQCVPYDSRLQAATVNEALYTFPNLGNYYEQPKPLVSPESEVSPPLPSFVHYASSEVPGRLYPVVGQGFAASTTATLKAMSGVVGGDSQNVSSASEAPLIPVAAAPSAGFVKPPQLTSFAGTLKMAVPKLKSPGESSTGGYSCTSAQCLSCKAMVVHGFMQSSKNASGAPPMLDDAAVDIDESLCLSSQPSPPPTQQQPSSKQPSGGLTPDEYSNVVSLLMPRSRRRKRADVNNKASNSSSQNLLGISTKIGCTYKKGDEITAGWTGLCNLCWQWRKLPDEYFPAYLNEVACDDSDEGCLAGFGSCNPVLRAVNVLHNLGTTEQPQWEQQSISTIAACECQVELGTPLHSLVMR